MADVNVAAATARLDGVPTVTEGVVTMNTLSQRAVALLLGITLAGIAGWSALTIRQPGAAPDVLPAWFRQAAIPLGVVPPDGVCVERPEALWVRCAAVRERFVPLVEREVLADGRTVRAAFSGSWAETRIVELRVDAPSFTALASFATDYGDGAGTLDIASSSAHTHDGNVCFDLSVRRFDGSSIQERWIGQLALP